MEMHGISVMNHPHHVWFITIDFMDFHFFARSARLPTGLQWQGRCR